jgi:hypothetical protein
LEQLQHDQRSVESGLTLLASIGSTAPFVGLFMARFIRATLNANAQGAQ